MLQLSVAKIPISLGRQFSSFFGSNHLKSIRRGKSQDGFRLVSDYSAWFWGLPSIYLWSFLPCAFLLPRFTSANMGTIFHPYFYENFGSWTMQLLISYGFWAVLFLLVFVTVKNTRMKSHPFLFCGWAVFSQIYGFIPITFRHTDETIKSYLVLSWCAIAFLFVLLFFTRKSLYRYHQTKVLWL